MKGYCSRGSVCWYKHDASSVPIPIIVEDGGKKTVIEVREPKGKEKVAVGSQDSELGVGESSLSRRDWGAGWSVSGACS